MCSCVRLKDLTTCALPGEMALKPTYAVHGQCCAILTARLCIVGHCWRSCLSLPAAADVIMLFVSQMDGWMDYCMDCWMDCRMDGWMDGWLDGWVEQVFESVQPLCISALDGFNVCIFACESRLIGPRGVLALSHVLHSLLPFLL